MSKSIKCKKGEILRKGYYRRGYERKKYIKEDGTVIPKTYVSGSYVEPVCIKDQGKPGHGKKTLPKPNNGFLRKYGYSIHESPENRHKSLREASAATDIITVLKHLNLIRNYQYIIENKKKFTQDVEYMKKLYANYKKKTQKGGKVYEEHIIDDKTISFENLNDNSICVKCDGDMQGKFDYINVDDRSVDVIKFNANKGYANLLASFMTKFFEMNGIDKITVIVHKKNKDFWTKQGYN